MKHAALCLAGAVLLAGPAFAAAAPAIAPYVKAAVADPRRPEADTKRDVSRKPAAQLMFAGVKPGSVIVDMLPGGGYFTRLFAVAVGDKGRVYAYAASEFDPFLTKRGMDPNDQLHNLKVIYPNLGVIHGPLGQFVTPEPVDIVWTEQNYHDLHNKSAGIDVAAVNKAVFQSLKPGGLYIVVDHRAAKGAGLGVTETLHRMDEDIAKREVEAAGFQLVAEGTALNNPSDDHATKAFEASEHDRTDQFMLKFRKPRR